MEKNNRESFVLHYYRHGRLNTQQAMRRVRQRAGLQAVAPRRWAFRRWAAVAVVVLLAGAFWLHRQLADAEVALLAGDVVQTFVLPDSSSVTLQPRSVLRYRRRCPRAVSLSGEAYFEVHHDDSRPFTVDNRLSRVSVLGTKFLLSERNGQSRLLVAEGRVRFSALGRGDGLVLSAGQEALLTDGDLLPQRVASAGGNALAWATGLLHFDHTPLPDVLADLSACFGVRLSAPGVEKRLTADFDVRESNIDEIIALIEQTLDVKITKDE